MARQAAESANERLSAALGDARGQLQGVAAGMGEGGREQQRSGATPTQLVEAAAHARELAAARQEVERWRASWEEKREECQRMQRAVRELQLRCASLERVCAEERMRNITAPRGFGGGIAPVGTGRGDEGDVDRSRPGSEHSGHGSGHGRVDDGSQGGYGDGADAAEGDDVASVPMVSADVHRFLDENDDEDDEAGSAGQLGGGTRVGVSIRMSRDRGRDRDRDRDRSDGGNRQGDLAGSNGS